MRTAGDIARKFADYLQRIHPRNRLLFTAAGMVGLVSLSLLLTFCSQTTGADRLVPIRMPPLTQALLPTTSPTPSPAPSQTQTASSTPTATASNTLTPTLQPTSSPTGTASPTVTALPSDTPQPTIMSGFTLISISSTATVGNNASVSIQTAAGAACSITYTTPKGTKSSAKGLGAQTAGQDGVCSWSWKIGSSTAPGTGSILISANGASQSYAITIVK